MMFLPLVFVIALVNLCYRRWGRAVRVGNGRASEYDEMTGTDSEIENSVNVVVHGDNRQ